MIFLLFYLICLEHDADFLYLFCLFFFSYFFLIFLFYTSEIPSGQLLARPSIRKSKSSFGRLFYYAWALSSRMDSRTSLFDRKLQDLWEICVLLMTTIFIFFAI